MTEPFTAARIAILDKMDMTAAEKLFAMKEFRSLFNHFRDTDPVKRALEARVNLKVYSAAFAMLTHAYETIFWESDADARREIERRHRDREQ